MADSHTCATGRVDLVVAVIFISHGELLKLPRDVNCGAGVGVPVGVHAVEVGGGRCRSLLLSAMERSIKALPATNGQVAWNATQLELGAIVTVLLLGAVASVGAVLLATTTTATSSSTAGKAPTASTGSSVG